MSSFQSTIADHGCLKSPWHQCAPSCLRHWSIMVVCQPALEVGLPIGDPSTTPTRGVGACHPHPSEFEIGTLTGVVCMLRAILSARSLTQLHAEFNKARGRFSPLHLEGGGVSGALYHTFRTKTFRNLGQRRIASFLTPYRRSIMVLCISEV